MDSMSLCMYLGVLYLLVGSYSCSPTTEPIVQLPFGKIRGQSIDDFYYFTNIPYAEPPTGNRRFEPPVVYRQNWTDVRDCTKPAKVCITFGSARKSYGLEDCLYVHVFTPSLKCDEYYPVRLHIHGGGFMIGSPVNSDPSILVKNGMVVVAMGYRLGPLGFLSSGDSLIPGNNGMKDQRLAIKWTKANVQSFCGDPNQILLAGESAGGASAHLHLLDKSTEKYVNAVASHNGVSTCPWAFETNPKDLFNRFTDYLDCPMSSSSVKACLQSKSIEELQKATSSLQYFNGNPFTVFAPVVEPPDSEDPFLTEHPEAIMKSGKAANLTWLVAYTEREGSCNAAFFLTRDENGTAIIDSLNKLWSDVAPNLLFYNNTKTGVDREQYSDYLKEKYLGNKEFSEENYRLFEDMYSDVLFKNDIKKAIELHRKNCDGRVYVYDYKYPHKFGIGNMLCSRSDVTFGADHMADTIFTIPLKHLKPKSLSDNERKISENLVDLYKSLANSGYPVYGGARLPLNSKTAEGRLVINEDNFVIVSSIEDSSS